MAQLFLNAGYGKKLMEPIREPGKSGTLQSDDGTQRQLAKVQRGIGAVVMKTLRMAARRPL
jgi:hypothetical protein